MSVQSFLNDDQINRIAVEISDITNNGIFSVDKNEELSLVRFVCENFVIGLTSSNDNSHVTMIVSYNCAIRVSGEDVVEAQLQVIKINNAVCNTLQLPVSISFGAEFHFSPEQTETPIIVSGQDEVEVFFDKIYSLRSFHNRQKRIKNNKEPLVFANEKKLVDSSGNPL